MTSHARWAVVAVALAACTTPQKKAAISTTMDDDARRRESFEATLRVLDEHPDYADELFAQALGHPRTLQRILHDAARKLDEPWLARMTAEELTARPAGLREVFVQTLDASRERPDARHAISQAMAERAELATRAMVSRPETVRSVTVATVDAVANDPGARAAFLAGMRERSDALAGFLVGDPRTTGVLFRAFVREGGAAASRQLGALLGTDQPSSGTGSGSR